MLPELSLQGVKQAAQSARVAGKANAVIDVSERQPRRIQSPKWRELIIEPCLDDVSPDYDTDPDLLYANG